MSKPIVAVDVFIYFKPIVMRVGIDTRDGEWDAVRVKIAANEIAHDRYRYSNEKPEIHMIEPFIK